MPKDVPSLSKKVVISYRPARNGKKFKTRTRATNRTMQQIIKERQDRAHEISGISLTASLGDPI